MENTNPEAIAQQIRSKMGRRSYEEIARDLHGHGQLLFCDFYYTEKFSDDLQRAKMLKRAALLETIVTALPRELNKSFCYGLEKIGTTIWSDSLRDAPGNWRDGDWVPKDDEYYELRYGLSLIFQAGTVHGLQCVERYNFEWQCHILRNFACKKGISDVHLALDFRSRSLLHVEVASIPPSPFEKVIVFPKPILSFEIRVDVPLKECQGKRLQISFPEVKLINGPNMQPELAAMMQDFAAQVPQRLDKSGSAPIEASIANVVMNCVDAWRRRYLAPSDREPVVRILDL